MKSNNSVNDFTGKIIGTWECGESFLKHYGKKTKKKVYPCKCIACGYERDITSSDLNIRRNLDCKVCNDKFHSLTQLVLNIVIRTSCIFFDCFF